MSKRILIVEDEALTRRVIREHASATGYEILEAENGNEAIAIIEAGDIDGIVLDILMPERDGIEVLMWLMNRGSDLPVVVFTQAGTDERINYPQVAERLGALKSFTKPITAEKMREAMEIIAGAQP